MYKIQTGNLQTRILKPNNSLNPNSIDMKLCTVVKNKYEFKHAEKK